MPATLDTHIKEQLQQENLRYISDLSTGFFRQKIGRNLKYYDIDGKILKDKKDLERIKNLIIPPAWQNVWICPKSNGHLQATGFDDKGRKQYIYHPDWINLSSQNKFGKMVDFGLNLPKIRAKVHFDMGSKTMDKRKILATVVWLLEHTFIRIGNEEYVKENRSYGLTTLRSEHVKVNGSQIVFKFKGKSGVYSNIETSNPIVARIIQKCIEIPGYELFQYIDTEGSRHVVDSEDVNLFLKDVTKDDFSAKDFRTWGATNLCSKNLFDLGFPENLKLCKKNVSDTIKKVSEHLHNTVSVCRNYYIHPTVIDTYQKNILIPHFTNHSKSKSKKSGLSWQEYALIKLLQKN